jgi:hypothetical protein
MNGYESALANPDSALNQFIEQRKMVVNPSRASIEAALAVYARLGGSEFMNEYQVGSIKRHLQRALAILEGGF